MTDAQIWQSLLIHFEQVGMRVKAREDSVLMKVVYYGALMWIWNRKFLTDFSTTVGGTVYMPRKWIDDRDWAVLAHEGVHVFDSYGRRWRWGLLYLFPQCLAPLALLAVLAAVWGPWWLLWLVFLAALAPWPAPWRVEAEVRGYAANLLIGAWASPTPQEAAPDAVLGLLRSFGYYRALWGDGKRHREWLRGVQDRSNVHYKLVVPYGWIWDACRGAVYSRGPAEDA